MPGINGFPGSKLVLQLFRQMTKPVSTKLINFAKDHQGFKKHFLVIPGSVLSLVRDDDQKIRTIRFIFDARGQCSDDKGDQGIESYGTWC